jgi:hypothetical protein
MYILLYNHQKTHTWTTHWRLQPFIQLCLCSLNEIHHHLMWYTVTSNPHIQSASVLCWLPKHKLDIPLLWYVQTTIVLPIYSKKSNIHNYVYFFIIFNFNYIYYLLLICVKSRTIVKIYKTRTFTSYGPVLHFYK